MTRFKLALFVVLFLAFHTFSPIFSNETVKTTPEQKIKETLALLSKGYEKEDIELAKSAYSKVYSGVHDESLTDVEKRLQDIFSALSHIKFNFTKIDITGEIFFYLGKRRMENCPRGSACASGLYAGDVT